MRQTETSFDLVKIDISFEDHNKNNSIISELENLRTIAVASFIESERIRIIGIDDLINIQKETFLHFFSVEIDNNVFKFGVYNLRDLIYSSIGRTRYDVVDLVYPISDNTFMNMKAVFYSYNPFEPVLYYENSASKKVMRVKFNRLYNVNEIKKFIAGIVFPGDSAIRDYHRVYIYEGSKKLRVFNSVSNLSYQNWRFEMMDFGFKLGVTAKKWESFHYPLKWPEENPSETEVKQLREAFTFFLTKYEYDKIDINNNVQDSEFFYFFFSIGTDLVSKVIIDYAQNYPMYIIENEIINDNTENIVIKVPKEDILAIYFFYYIKIKKKPDSICILNTNMDEIVNKSTKNGVKINSYLCEKYALDSDALSEFMFKKYGIANVLRNVYVHQEGFANLINRVVFSYLTKSYGYSDNQKFHDSDEYINLRKYFHEKYKELKANQKNSSKLVNEVALFKLCSFYFEDAIYQYRPKWLGLKSIDIYIPQLSIGIEYQGAQHYEKQLAYSQDHDQFKKNKERDEMKKNLCTENGVLLIYWPYSKKITAFELYKIIKQVTNVDFTPIFGSIDSKIAFKEMCDYKKSLDR
jgi:hypothetical protein